MAKKIYNKNAREKALLEEAYSTVYNEGLRDQLQGRGPDQVDVATDQVDVATDQVGSAEISSEELDKGTPNAHGAMITPRAIFVGANSLPHFQEVVRQKGLDKLNIQFLQSVEKPELGVIVVPYSKEAVNMDIDKILIDENPPDNKGGFWGQKGVGYKGKHWTPIGTHLQ